MQMLLRLDTVGLDVFHSFHTKLEEYYLCPHVTLGKR